MQRQRNEYKSLRGQFRAELKLYLFVGREELIQIPNVVGN